MSESNKKNAADDNQVTQNDSSDDRSQRTRKAGPMREKQISSSSGDSKGDSEPTRVSPPRSGRPKKPQPSENVSESEVYDFPADPSPETDLESPKSQEISSSLSDKSDPETSEFSEAEANPESHIHSDISKSEASEPKADLESQDILSDISKSEASASKGKSESHPIRSDSSNKPSKRPVDSLPPTRRIDSDYIPSKLSSKGKDEGRRDRPISPAEKTRRSAYPPTQRYSGDGPLAPPPSDPPVRRPPNNSQPPMRRMLMWLVGLLVVAIVVFVVTSVFIYSRIAAQLPPARELRARSVQFATTEILDREGQLLWEIIDPTGGRRTAISFDQISPHLINATVATEDRFFYRNVGVDPIAIARAVYYNLTAGEVVSGASTITQQLARNVLLTQEERTQQSLSRKIREAVLAVEINRRYSKTEILEIYLNHIYYGNLAYGIEAASQTYFGKSANELTLSEAALLAGLPQSPAFHDPFVNPEGAKRRQEDVLRLMVEAKYISSEEAEAAKAVDLQFQELSFAFKSPHFVSFVRQELETIVPADYIYQAGLRVQTTLDPRLQQIAAEEIRQQVDRLAGRNVTNGALVAMDVDSGQILALVGSKDFQNEAIDGQINMAIVPRQPGSTMKPLTFLAAFEQLDWTPSTLLMDVPVTYADGAGNVYRPRNYDEKFHGPVSLRVALANSYNIPPVKTLDRIGVAALKEIAARLGITTLTRNDYGLALTLGSGEVPLVEMTGAYQAIANQGRLVPPTTILRITDNFGQVIEPVQPPSQQVLLPQHAYLMTDILADNEARSISFGPNSALNLSRPAAAKTGTTNDFRDNWTIGYTPQIVTGVWVGNANNTPMINVSGLSGAGPIWQNFMEQAHQGLPVNDFVRPPGIVEMEVCADSGTIPSEACPERRMEIFYEEQPPLGPEHDIHQRILIDLNTGLRANESCQSNVEVRYYRVYPSDGWEWAISQGYNQPPQEYCPSANVVARITQPVDGGTVRGTVNLIGSASATNFSHYQVELGEGTTPQSTNLIHGPVYEVREGVLGTFDTSQLENGPYTLRLVVFNTSGSSAVSEVRVLVDNEATATPTETSTPIVATDTPTPTATPTLQPPTLTLTPTPTPTPTLTPTFMPPTATLTPTPIPTTPLPPPPLPDTPTATIPVPPTVTTVPPSPTLIPPTTIATATPLPGIVTPPIVQ